MTMNRGGTRSIWRRGRSGFTLVELMVVVVIISILAAVAVPIYLNQRSAAWKSTVETDVHNASLVVETVMAANGGVATGLTASPATITSAGGSIATPDGNSRRVAASSGDSLTFDFSNSAGYVIKGTNTGLGTDSAYTYTSWSGSSTWGDPPAAPSSPTVVDPTSKWVGTANASKSQLVRNGSVIATNIIPDPVSMTIGANDSGKFRASGGTPSNVAVSDQSIPTVTKGISIAVSGTGNGGVTIDAPNSLAAGSYVFAVWGRIPKGSQMYLQMGWDRAGSGTGYGLQYFTGDGNWHQYVVSATLPATLYSYAYMYGVGAGTFTFAAPMFCTTADWQAMQAAGVQWFGGSTVMMAK